MNNRLRSYSSFHAFEPHRRKGTALVKYYMYQKIVDALPRLHRGLFT